MAFMFTREHPACAVVIGALPEHGASPIRARAVHDRVLEHGADWQYRMTAAVLKWLADEGLISRSWRKVKVPTALYRQRRPGDDNV